VISLKRKIVVGGDIQYGRTVNVPLIYSSDDWIARGMKWESLPGASGSDTGNVHGRIIKDAATKDAYRANPWRFGAVTFADPGGKFYIEEQRNAVEGGGDWAGNTAIPEDIADGAPSGSLPVSLCKSISHFNLGTYNDLLFSGLIIEWSANMGDSVWEDPLKEHPPWLAAIFTGVGIAIAIACTCGAAAGAAVAGGATAAIAGGAAAGGASGAILGATGGGFTVAATTSGIIAPVVTAAAAGGISVGGVLGVIGSVGTAVSIAGGLIEHFAPPGSDAAKAGAGMQQAGAMAQDTASGADASLKASTTVDTATGLAQTGAKLGASISGAAGQQGVTAMFNAASDAATMGANAVKNAPDIGTAISNVSQAGVAAGIDMIQKAASTISSVSGITIGTATQVSGKDAGIYLSHFALAVPYRIEDIRMPDIQLVDKGGADIPGTTPLTSEEIASGQYNKWANGGGLAEALKEYANPPNNAKGGTYYVPMVPPDAMCAYVQRRRLGASVSESLTYARKVAPFNWRWATINYGTILSVDQLAKRLDALIDIHKKNEDTAAASSAPDAVKLQAGCAKPGYVPPERTAKLFLPTFTVPIRAMKTVLASANPFLSRFGSVPVRASMTLAPPKPKVTLLGGLVAAGVGLIGFGTFLLTRKGGP
jgi:hypothetical protein